MVGGGVYQRVLRCPGGPIPTLTFGAFGRYTRRRGPLVACGILSNRSCGRAGSGVIRAELGDPMTEILTESFCERCGTRYTFESARPRVRLKGVKVLSRGLKNFVMSDDSSIDEAMAAARSDTDRELTAHQLDAFHKTFNFCMSCRQYTCPNCWNEAEARCLSCAPHLGQEVMPAPFPDLVTSSYLVADPVDTAVTNGSNGHDAVAEDASASGVDVADDAPSSGVDVADFAARLQALMAPPAREPGRDRRRDRGRRECDRRGHRGRPAEDAGR